MVATDGFAGFKTAAAEEVPDAVAVKEELRTSDLVWGDVDRQRLVPLVTCDDELGWRPDG